MLELRSGLGFCAVTAVQGSEVAADAKAEVEAAGVPVVPAAKDTELAVDAEANGDSVILLKLLVYQK